MFKKKKKAYALKYKRVNYQNFVRADRFLDVVDTGLLSPLHGIVALETTDIHEKVLQHSFPMLRQVHLRVKLHPIEFFAVVANTCSGER